MANLRADKVCGADGMNAIRGSVFFNNSEVDYLTVSVDGDLTASDTFNYLHDGTKDFNVECWIKPSKSGDRQTVISTGGHSDTRGFAFRIMEDGATGGSGGTKVFVQISRGSSGNYLGFLGGTLDVDSWSHVALVFTTSNKQLAIYVNGVLTNSSDLDGTASGTFGSGDFASGNSTYPMEIGREPYPNGTMYLDGVTVSNLRICEHVVYSGEFTPPTSELVVHTASTIMCCQDTDDPTQDATGKEILGFGGLYQGKRYSNIATNGDLETGDTTGWTNSGCSTFEVSNFSHSGSYSLHCVSDGNGDAVYATASVNTLYRYKISAYINCVGPAGTSAKAKMKIGTSVGANTNYESQTADAGAGWQYVEWIGLPSASTTYITFNESSANDVNDWYVDDLRVELWYPEEGVNILPNPDFLTGATGWSFSSTPSGEYTISSNRLNVADTSRTSDAFATVQLFTQPMKEGKYKVTIDYVLTSDDFDIGIGNNRIFGVAGGGTYSGAGNSASVTYEIEAGSTNSSLRIVANQNCVGYFNNITLSRVPEPKRINELPPVGEDSGVQFDGYVKHNSPNYMYFPTGDTSQRGRGTALFGGGYKTPNSITAIDYLSIQSGGLTEEWGNLSTTQLASGSALSSNTRYLKGGGWTGANNNAIEYVTFTTQGNSLEFGDLTVGRRNLGNHSNDTRGLWAGGYISPADAGTDTIDYVTIASKGNAADFGNLSAVAKTNNGTGSTTRAVFTLGTSSPASVDTIEYVTIATTGNATDFGNLEDPLRDNGSCSNGTRAVFAGGTRFPHSAVINTLQFITISSTGNTSDFGDLTLARGAIGGTSNGTRGVFMGGTTNPARQHNIDSITIATTGNAVNWGEFRIDKQGLNAAASDSHGGLS